MPHRRLALLLVAAVATVVAGCSGEPTDDSVGSTVAPAASEVVDRLLVVDGTGNVVTMDPDGSGVETLTSDAGNTLGYFQPSWAPDAKSIAVSRFTAGRFSLVTIDLASLAESSVATENNAFYTFWSPQGDRIAYLSAGADGMGLSIAEFGDAPTSTPVDLGRPFYFSWSPDGKQLATFIGEQRLEVRGTDPDSPAVAIEPNPGSFQNPAWTSAGIVYTSRVNGSEQLVVRTPDGESQVIARIPAPAIFTVSPSGDRIAIQPVGNQDAVSASFQEAPLLPLNQLVIVDTATREVTRVTDSMVVAYFWDPSGEKLLVLDENRAERRLRWSVWADGELTQLTDFLPSRVWADTFLPFFGQYSLSTTMWAPDGSAFVFPGLIGDRGGIYVQEVAGGDPVFVTEGDWATWSPR